MSEDDIVEKIIELLERMQYGDKIGRTVWLAKVLIGWGLISLFMFIAYIIVSFLL